MPRRLRYTDQAIADLDTIHRWLTQAGSGPAAIRRLKSLRSAIRQLKQAPCLHPVGDHPGVRELPIERHRVMYVVAPDTNRDDTAGDVVVLRVFGPGQARDRI